MILALVAVGLVLFVGIVGFSICLGMAAKDGDEMQAQVGDDYVDGRFVPPVRR